MGTSVFPAPNTSKTSYKLSLTSGTSWTVPSNVTQINVTLVGGGGGGGAYTGGVHYTGGSGGSGVVILQIPNTLTATFSGGVTQTMSTAVSGYKTYTITATSTTSETVTFS